MKKGLLICFSTVLLLFLVSCRKNLENRMTGTWKLTSSYKKISTGVSETLTGYEAGYFRLENDGRAYYIEGADSMTGTWKTDKQYKGYYNNNTGFWETRHMRFLQFNLYNDSRFRPIEWRFDDFFLRQDGNSFRGEQYALGYDRYYEFRRY